MDQKGGIRQFREIQKQTLTYWCFPQGSPVSICHGPVPIRGSCWDFCGVQECRCPGPLWQPWYPALLKSSPPGEGSPNWSHVEGLASLSLQNMSPASSIVWQGVCCMGTSLSCALGSGLHRHLSTALQSQLIEHEPVLPRDSSGPAHCPQSKTCLSLSLSVHSRAAALGHGRGTGLAVGRVSVPCSATDSLLRCG